MKCHIFSDGKHRSSNMPPLPTLVHHQVSPLHIASGRFANIFNLVLLGLGIMIESFVWNSLYYEERLGEVEIIGDFGIVINTSASIIIPKERFLRVSLSSRSTTPED